MHGFVDESIRRRYLLWCVTVHPRDLDASRRELRTLLLPGQRRLHFVHEASPRMKVLLSRMSRMNVRAAIYDCSGIDDKARRAGLERLVDDLLAVVSRSRRNVAPSYTGNRRHCQEDRALRRADPGRSPSGDEPGSLPRAIALGTSILCQNALAVRPGPVAKASRRRPPLRFRSATGSALVFPWFR
jgi:hypothetical protein